MSEDSGKHEFWESNIVQLQLTDTTSGHIGGTQHLELVIFEI